MIVNIFRSGLKLQHVNNVVFVHKSSNEVEQFRFMQTRKSLRITLICC